MKVIFLTGSHPRHAFMAHKLYEAGHLTHLVVEQRKEHVPTPPDNLSPELKSLFNLHFKKREEAESRFFKNIPLPDVPTIHVSREELNTEKTHKFIQEANPDVLISYGVHMLSNETINCCNGHSWNIHGGLSPWYRGCITHFWPSYQLEPQMTGMTLHNLTQQLDAGAIVHQNVAPLVKGDGIHDLACRAVMTMANDLPKVISKLEKEGRIETKDHKTSGKLWVAKDWRPDHLKLIYEFYNDRIVDLFLSGEISGPEPTLYSQL